MRNTLIWFGLVVALAGVAGCKKDKKEADPAEGTAPTAETTPPSVDTPPPVDTPPAEDPTKSDMPNDMKWCPSAAPGATTAVKESKTAVVVTVTSKDKAAVAEIQKRAKHLSTLDTSADAEVKHTGEGTGGGKLGKCPVVMTDVTLKVKDTKTGSEITMTPKDAAGLADLAKTAKDRLAAMPAPGDAAAGGDAPKEGDAPAEGDAPK